MTSFIDRAKILVRAGKGGDGCLSFRREKNVPRGGPDGGRGGKGGDVYIEAKESVKTLIDFHFRPFWKAINGGHGRGKNQQGKDGQDLIIPVPLGCVLWKQGNFFADLIHPGQRMMCAQGGRGGRGNADFKSQRCKAPKKREIGQPGEEVSLYLELKLIADVGLVGFPNAGKSTFLRKVSSAQPKVAPYPFTTLVPYLGVVKINDFSFVIADIPGIIEGAHEGRGLGIDFLRHIQRTKLLIFLLDLTQNPEEQFTGLVEELKSFDKSLLKRPKIICANKIDIEETRTKFEKLKTEIVGNKLYPVSALKGEGLNKVLGKCVEILKSAY